MLVEPFIPFLLFVLALYATPGPATLSIAASGSAFGFRNTIGYAFGLVIGLMIIFILVSAGLIQLFNSFPWIHTSFLIVSSVYIVYLAYKIATAPINKVSGANRLGFFQGIPLNLFNPKAYFAVLSTVVQFAGKEDTGYADFILVAGWVFILALITNLIWAFMGSIIGARFSSGTIPKKINYLFAILLILSILWVALG